MAQPSTRNTWVERRQPALMGSESLNAPIDLSRLACRSCNEQKPDIRIGKQVAKAFEHAVSVIVGKR